MALTLRYSRKCHTYGPDAVLEIDRHQRSNLAKTPALADPLFSTRG